MRLVDLIPRVLRHKYRRWVLDRESLERRVRHVRFLKTEYLPHQFGMFVNWLPPAMRPVFEELFLTFDPLTNPDRTEVAIEWPDYPHRLYLRRNSSDLPTFCQIFVEQQYKHLTASDCDHGAIIDCGANIGLAAVWFLWMLRPQKLIAIEPDRGNLAVCSRNVAPFGDIAQLVNGAVWHTGELPFEIDDPGLLEWSLRCRVTRDADSSATLRTVQMPDVIALARMPRISLLKIDIEGAEAELFGPEGNAAKWLADVDNIAIELHGPECTAALLRSLEGLEFSRSTRGEITWITNIWASRCRDAGHNGETR